MNGHLENLLYTLSRLIAVSFSLLLAAQISVVNGQNSNNSVVPATTNTSAQVVDSNWPQWRGSAWNHLSNDTKIPLEFGKGKNLLWRVEMPGPGGSSPVVWNDQVFLTSVDGDAIDLICVDPVGHESWRRTLEGKNKDSRDGANSAAPSPCTDGKHVWATSGAGFLQCFTMTGQPVWTIDLQEKYGEFDIQFGMTSTPILDSGRLYLQLIHGDMGNDDPGDAWVIALNADTGKEIWKQFRATEAIKENKHSYASPVIYRDSQTEFLITHGGDYAIGHSLTDGSELWRMGGLNAPESYNPYLRFVASPTCAPGMIVVPSAKNGPVLCLRPELKGNVTAEPFALLWKLDKGTPDVASPLIHNDLVYLFRENGLLAVVDAKTGHEIFNERFFDDRHRSCAVMVGDKLIVTCRNGGVAVVEGGRKPRVISKCELGEEITSSPAISNGRIYIRTFAALYAFGQQ